MPNVAFFIKQTIQLTILYKKNTKQSFKFRLRWTVSDPPEKLDPDLALEKQARTGFDLIKFWDIIIQL